MIPQSQNDPEHLKIVNKAMQEMVQNKSPGQPGAPQTSIGYINPLNKNKIGIAPATPETQVLGKTAVRGE